MSSAPQDVISFLQVTKNHSVTVGKGTVKGTIANKANRNGLGGNEANSHKAQSEKAQSKAQAETQRHFSFCLRQSAEQVPLSGKRQVVHQKHWDTVA